MRPDERRAFVAALIGTAADDFTPDDLRAIANGPIMDAGRIYLPAGRLTPAETDAREARIRGGLSA